MAIIWIKPWDVDAVRDRLCQNGRDIRHFNLDRACWYIYRNVDLSCSRNQEVPITDLYYHFCLTWNSDYQAYEDCFVQLNVSPNNYSIRPLLDYLHKKTDGLRDLLWLSQYCCRLNKPISSNSDLAEKFQEIISIFDPFIEEFFEEKERLDKAIAFGEGAPYADIHVDSLQCEIVKVKDLPFSTFRIPSYQRTYKWTPTNVNQLINDIREFANSSSYRLGSLVLNNGDIVDGQQRIVTLSLLLHRLMRNPEIRSHEEYTSLFEQVTGFWGRTEYDAAEALDNIVSNATAIRMRQNDLDFEFFYSLVENCEFVVIRLPKLHEAFQFFDSQNARGKDLEAHDLLKAYHLREMGTLDDVDMENIRLWQKIATPELVALFLCLYRIRMWSKGESARFFTKSDISEFKGLSIGKEKHPMPLYMQAVLLNKLFTEFTNNEDKTLARKDYPFQISGLIINGSRFFDMILHYEELYSHITNSNWSGYDSDAKDILTLLGDYDGMYRTGDEYVRNVFDALMLFFVDKFGTREIGKAAKLFFLYAYSIRITQFRVSLASIDNTVVTGPLFKIIRDAIDPYDVLNFQIPPIHTTDLAQNRSENLLRRFEDLNMIIAHE